MNIEKIYTKIDEIEEDNHNKASLYYSIIQIKFKDQSSTDIRNSIYLDTKNFIIVYIKSIDNRDLGYDIIDVEKLKKSIKFCGNTLEQYQLSLLAYRLLKTKGFEDESKKMKAFVNEKKTRWLYSKPYKFGKYFNLILHLSTYNLCSIIITIILLMVFSFIIFLPAPYKCWETFDITYHNYSGNFLLNHLANITSNLFAIDNDFKVETNSIIGIITLISIKFFYILFIVNYLYKKVIDILNSK
nr:hypothetical protein [uncultured Carboxylicivirga sp.]